MSDSFVVQDGDSYLDFTVRHDLGLKNENYHMYFRDGELEYIRVYTSDPGVVDGNFPGYDRMIENKWRNEGYVDRNV